jgi:hypothetical protein
MTPSRRLDSDVIAVGVATAATQTIRRVNVTVRSVGER